MQLRADPSLIRGSAEASQGGVCGRSQCVGVDVDPNGRGMGQVGAGAELDARLDQRPLDGRHHLRHGLIHDLSVVCHGDVVRRAPEQRAKVVAGSLQGATLAPDSESCVKSGPELIVAVDAGVAQAATLLTDLQR